MHVDAGTKTDVIEFKTHYNEFQYETMLGKENEKSCEIMIVEPQKEKFYETVTITPQEPITILTDKYELPEI